MSGYIWFALIASLVAIIYGLVLARSILKKSAGNARMQEIAKAIQDGAGAYLNKQYKTIGIIAAILFLIIGFIPKLGWTMAIGFLVGAFLSALAGYIGMNVSVRANVRTTEAARSGINAALSLAFKGGTLLVFSSSVSLFSVSPLFMLSPVVSPLSLVLVLEPPSFPFLPDSVEEYSPKRQMWVQT
jgi:K(+)-stimulated pyrophosphate-energized sodium pump